MSTPVVSVGPIATIEPDALDGEITTGTVPARSRRIDIAHVNGFGAILGHVMAMNIAFDMGRFDIQPPRRREPEPRMIEHKPREMNRAMARSEAKVRRKDKKHRIKGLRP